MNKTCRSCQNVFEITDEDVAFYEKMEVPSPTFCSMCRMQRRLAWRNDRKLYKRTCDVCKKSIISICHEDTLAPVYCHQCWWSDTWNPLEYGKEFDFNKSFFEQFNSLNQDIPKRAIINDNGIRSENSEYCQDCVNVKNCYMAIETGDTKDSYYAHQSNRSVEVVDCYQTMNSELAYETIVCQKLYHCSFLQNCEECSDCFFGYNLRGCKNCFGCVNLRQKQYCFFNEQLTQEEYFKKLSEFQVEKYLKLKDFRQYFQNFKLKFPHQFANFKNCENSLGNDLFNCKNVLGYGIFNGYDCKFVNNMDTVVNIYDGQGWKSQWCIESQTCDESWMARFSAWCESCKNIDYCYYCYNSCQNLFGCIGLKHAQYCILNKQYTKEEYEILVPKIIEHMQSTGEWGEFFPISLSPFAYNETVAQEYFPLTKEEALQKGYKWRDPDKREYLPQSYIIPDSILDVQDDICQAILACTSCGKNYKIIKQELDFYRKMNIPIPRKCPDCRHLDRMLLRNPRKLYKRNCMKCGTEIQTTYSPERPEIVYCEECYLKEVY